MKKRKLEWYIAETNSFIYDEDVIELITPKLNDSIETLDSIKNLIKSYKENLNSPYLTDKYLEYEELLSTIQVILECHFDR